MKAKRAVLCLLTLTMLIALASAQERATKVRITTVDPSGSPIGDPFSIPCEGSRCRGPCWFEVSGVSYRFEALALFAPGYARIAGAPLFRRGKDPGLAVGFGYHYALAFLNRDGLAPGHVREFVDLAAGPLHFD